MTLKKRVFGVFPMWADDVSFFFGSDFYQLFQGEPLLKNTDKIHLNKNLIGLMNRESSEITRNFLIHHHIIIYRHLLAPNTVKSSKSLGLGFDSFDSSASTSARIQQKTLQNGELAYKQRLEEQHF